MPNELDMDAYHSEGIDPGEHKVFNITSTIHSFNERFQGEPPVSAGPGLEGYDPDKMPDWWVKVLKPLRSTWPGDPGPKTLSNRGVDRNYEEPLEMPLGQDRFQPISEKQKGPFDIPLEGGGGARFGETITTEPLFKSSRGRPPAEVSESLSNVEKGIKEGLDAGKSTYEIANEIGMSQSGLRRYMEKRGWKSQYPQVGGENALSAYTKDQDKQLLSLQDQGMSFSQIAKETGLTRGKVAGRLSRLNYANQFEGGPIEPAKLTLEEKIQAFQKKYGYDRNPVSPSNDIEYTRAQERLLTEIPELRQKPFHPDKQKESDEWVESLSYRDYLRMLGGDLKPPF